jgi:hypothetical protein
VITVAMAKAEIAKAAMKLKVVLLESNVLFINVLIWEE